MALSAVRVALAALTLAPLLSLHHLWPALRRHWRAIAFVGVANSALPFVAYSYAALSITSGLSSVFNATSPLWASLIAWLWLRDQPTKARALGLAIGFAGVLWLVWDKATFRPDAASTSAGWAIVACLAATLCYGFSASFTKRHLTGVPPLAVAGGSQISASMALALPALWLWPAATPPAVEP